MWRERLRFAGSGRAEGGRTIRLLLIALVASGTISSAGPGFVGTLTGANGVAGGFAGAFFGPKALEMGSSWYLSGNDFSASGRMIGIRE